MYTISFPGITDEPPTRSRRTAYWQHYLLYCHFEDKDNFTALCGLLSIHDIYLEYRLRFSLSPLGLQATNLITIALYLNTLNFYSMQILYPHAGHTLSLPDSVIDI